MEKSYAVPYYQEEWSKMSKPCIFTSQEQDLMLAFWQYRHCFHHSLPSSTAPGARLCFSI